MEKIKNQSKQYLYLFAPKINRKKRQNQVLWFRNFMYNKRKSKNTIDIIFKSCQIRENIIKCNISQKQKHNLDHIPSISSK